MATYPATGIVIGRTEFTTDLSAFLPQSPTKEQQVLLDQLRDGVVSRLILVGIEGGVVSGVLNPENVGVEAPTVTVEAQPATDAASQGAPR